MTFSNRLLGEKSVVPGLMELLQVKQEDKYVRVFIMNTLGTLGEKSVVPDLIELLRVKQEDEKERSIAEMLAITLGNLVDDSAIVQELATLLQTSDVADNIHRALWEICRRMRITLYITDGQTGPEVKVVPWE